MQLYSSRVTLAGIPPEVVFGGGRVTLAYPCNYTVAVLLLPAYLRRYVVFGGGRVTLALDASMHAKVVFGGGHVTLAFP